MYLARRLNQLALFSGPMNLATAKIYHMLAHDFEESYAQLFKPEQLQFKEKKVQPCTRKQLDFLQALCIHHNIKMKDEPEKMSRSEASKCIDDIIKTYGRMYME